MGENERKETYDEIKHSHDPRGTERLSFLSEGPISYSSDISKLFNVYFIAKYMLYNTRYLFAIYLMAF